MGMSRRFGLGKGRQGLVKNGRGWISGPVEGLYGELFSPSKSGLDWLKSAWLMGIYFCAEAEARKIR